MKSTGWFWVAGIALAAVGVVLARVVAPAMQPPSPLVTILGHLLALGGLLTIAVGVRRKYAGREGEPPPGQGSAGP